MYFFLADQRTLSSVVLFCMFIKDTSNGVIKCFEYSDIMTTRSSLVRTCLSHRLQRFSFLKTEQRLL